MKRSTMQVCTAVLFVALASALAGCGGSKTPTATPTTAVKDAALAAQVSTELRGRTLTVGTDAALPPSEFLDPGSKEFVGSDIDLMNAIASVLDLRIAYKNVPFATIVQGVQKGAFDLGISSIYDTQAREESVDFATYFQAGGGIYVKTGTELSTTSQLCGKTVEVLAGTVYVDTLKTLTANCKEGDDITIRQVPRQADATNDVLSGKAFASLIDEPVARWIVKQSGAKLAVVGPALGVKPYGIAVAKDSGLAEPLNAAINALIKQGTYGAILQKWGLSSDAIKESVVNGAIE